MKRLASMFVLLVFLILVGCSSHASIDSGSGEETKNDSNSEENQSDENKKLRLGWGSDGGFPSPFAFSPVGPAGYLRVSYIYDSLAWKDEEGLQPWLAKDWKISEDGLKYEVHLRKGIEWHDGEALTASDVKFTFDYIAKHGFAWGDTSMVDAVKVKDESTIVITLNKPYSPFVEEVMGIIPIIPEHVWSEVDDPVAFRGEGATVGTGPYKLITYNQESGQYLFEANPDYFKGKPVIDEITYVTVDNQVLALKNKDLDAARINYKDIKAFEKAGYKVMESNPHGSIVRIVFNLEQELLGQKEMRQAIAYALDRETIAKKVLGGNIVVGNAGVIPPGSPWYNPDVKKYKYNQEKAKEILKELGYTDQNNDGMLESESGEPLTLNLMVASNARDGQLMKDMLENVGIKVNLQKVDKTTFTTSMGENNYDMAITGHIGVSGDPDFLRRWFTGTEYNEFAARGSVLKNEKFHNLAQKQLTIADFRKRKEVVDQIQEVLAEEVPTLPIYHRPFYWAYDSSEFNGWFNTWGGIANGIPLWENKAAFLPHD
ncbi:ABC transporter substrate-binding protein [Alkalihalobacillus sp. AL-G]|uniref:ABC transporter substrate-binding protein n=1 Tax=Alkalihalobacillus sp. AL-G TaxID=2926399 RepID=UPI00272BAFCF|nr:ABC transporter substrate-binding protein [Alkalihalobacillus sp. AL-G]WLD94572.1 ABC transporter substrate-binding protein [Alkalihalobacillus sp. AL-G]